MAETLLRRSVSARRSLEQGQYNGYFKRFANSMVRKMPYSANMRFDDAMSELLMVATKALDAYEEDRGATFGTFLFRRLRNHVGSRVRGEHRRKSNPQHLEYDQCRSIQDRTRSADQKCQLCELMEKMSPCCRRAMVNLMKARDFPRLLQCLRQGRKLSYIEKYAGVSKEDVTCFCNEAAPLVASYLELEP